MKGNYLHLYSTRCWADRELPAMILKKDAKYALTIMLYFEIYVFIQAIIPCNFWNIVLAPKMEEVGKSDKLNPISSEVSLTSSLLSPTSSLSLLVDDIPFVEVFLSIIVPICNDGVLESSRPSVSMENKIINK